MSLPSLVGSHGQLIGVVGVTVTKRAVMELRELGRRQTDSKAIESACRGQ
jgi:hypothetical protein